MTMDTAGMIRPKTVEGATANLAAYLINHQPTPDGPMAQALIEVLCKASQSLEINSFLERRRLHTRAVDPDIVQKTLEMISRKA